MREGRRAAKERRLQEQAIQIDKERQLEDYHRRLRVVKATDEVDTKTEALNFCLDIVRDVHQRGKLFDLLPILSWARNYL